MIYIIFESTYYFLDYWLGQESSVKWPERRVVLKTLTINNNIAGHLRCTALLFVYVWGTDLMTAS